jgi:two-component system, NarL family, sensor histidine kinase BarA
MGKNLPVIDLALGARLIDKNEEIAKEMINDLVESLPSALEDLKKAHKKKDIKLLGDVAHYIHGPTCYTGTPRLKEAAFQLERLSRGRHSFQELEAAYHTLCKEIDAVIEKSKKMG